MDIEKAKICLKGIKSVAQESLDIAIKSIDMWDLVIEEIKEFVGVSINDVEVISKNDVIDIIENYKKEIEDGGF